MTSDSEGIWSGTGLDSVSPMVGRADELELLRSRVDRLREGEGGIVSLVGRAGVGKSRLVREALADPRMEEVRLLVARSLSVGTSLSFHPFTDLLRSWAGIEVGAGAGDDEAVARLAECIGDLCGAEADEVVPFVASLMGLETSGATAERLAGIEGEALERLIFRSMRLLFQHMAARRPVLLFFEDLHWADRSSVRLLEVLLRLVSEHPILFVNAFRPEHVDTGQRILEVARSHYPLQHRLIRLHALDAEESAELAGKLLGGASDGAQAALIAECSEGSPFFVEEIVRSLIDQGVVVIRDGRASVEGELEKAALPTTIGELVAARTRALDPVANRILEVGAVTGRTFFGRILQEVMKSDAELDGVVDSLKNRGILIERSTRRTGAHVRVSFVSEVEYVFRHALVQETIYESIEPARRRELHAQVAAAIESVFANRIADFHGMLAYHYLRAEHLAKAEEYLFKAGEEAARAAASSEALSFFRDASRVYLQLHGGGGDPAKKALLERHIGLALMNTGELTEAMEHFDRSLTNLGDPPRSALAAGLRCAGELVSIFARAYLPGFRSGGRGDDRYRDHILALYPRIKAQSTSDPTRLVFDYTRAVYLLNKTDPAVVPDQVIGLYSGFAAMFAYSGISFRIGRRYLDLADGMRRPGHAKDLFDHSCLVCICNYLEGEWGDEPGTVPDDVVRQALRYGGLWEVNTYLGLDCDRRLRRGNFAGARERLDELADIAETYGFEFARTNHTAETMLLMLEERRLEEALDAANLYLSSVDDAPLRVLALGSKAKAQVLLGDLVGASESLIAAEEIVDAAPVIPPWHHSACVVARLRHDLEVLSGAPEGDREKAAKAAESSARQASRLSGRVAVQRGEVLRLTARLHYLLGDADSAKRWAGKAIAECERLGALPELARTHADVAAWQIDLGDGRDSAAHLARAEEIFVSLGLSVGAGAHRKTRRAA